ncbi:F-BOX/RNI SUPERFAMILY PROTEIN-RELATED [Salix purpurea]|uniref:F-BOX/RNI SUPERFAMILY PROTEIN-RELATED n=1 Tax=Salix purpurea TaxID=77065 RepID=A0A9Q1AGL7_SALPP|nr:F-BOX/RNI SUPERFAMILY PROTEIN-RELATED [Salix purpurea]
MEETASGDNCQNLCEKANEDVISELRDDILCYMLSFLPTKSAVATSILSTRWRNLWKSVTILDIYDDISGYHKNPFTYKERKMNFVNFMDRLFIHRNYPSILKFRLILALSYDFSCVNAWMSHLSRWISSSAIMGNVEELIFYINFPVRLPENLYCCEKLVTLKLHGHIRFDNLQSVCFPSLKALHLEHLRMLNNTAIEVLLSGSPALEELELEMEGRDSRRSVHVCSLSLKRLIIGFVCVFNVGIEEYANMGVQFYRQISGVKTLSLSNFNIRTLLGAAVSKFPCFGNLPTFRNLIHLEVRVSDDYVWILPEILQCSSNLEVFVLILDEDAYGWNWCAPHSVPQCLSSCLQVIEYKVFQGESGETEMLEYFLSNALVLKKMTITHPDDLETLEVDVLKRLSTCPKGSDACQIVLIPEHKRSFEVASMRRASFFSESFNY